MEHMDVSEPYSSEGELSFSGSDFEFQLKPSSTSQSKKTKVALSLTPAAPRARQQRSPAPGPACLLFEAVRSGRSALPTLIDDWLDTYRSNREAGLLELINFVVQCSGCKGVVTREMFDGLQNADIISYLTNDFSEESVNYPLVSTSSEWRRFRENLSQFVSVLVHGCRNTVLYDDFLFSSLIALLTCLSDSQVRAFRHTSTMIAMRLMSCVVAVAADVQTQTLTTHRRCELEKNREPAQRAADRAEELENSYRELLEHQEDLHSLINNLYNGVFIHRYRDRVPEVRAICMEEIRAWLQQHPSYFLNDEYLKYVGWMLHDKHAAVRLQCVLTLQKLYMEFDLISQMELFLSRFKERILRMVLDKDTDVAVETFKLLLLMKQTSKDGLSEEECARLCPLVFAADRGLACAAGRFLYQTLRSVLEENGNDGRGSFQRLLAHYFTQSKIHVHAAYLVDALWEVAAGELKDWKLMTSLLLQDGGVEDELEAALIDIMVCAVRQATEATPPVTRSSKKALSAREKKQQVLEKSRITNHFVPVLPQLLSRFSADVGKVSCLLQVPLCFQLEMYSTSGHMEKCLDALLSGVCDLVLKHTEECVLEACMRVLSALGGDSYSFSARVENSVSQLTDSTMEKFTSHLKEILQGSADEDDLYAAASSLNILSAFSSTRDVSGTNLFLLCVDLLMFGLENMDMDEKLMVPAVKCATFHLLWEALKVKNNPADQILLKNVTASLNSFGVLCLSCLCVPHSHIRDQTFLCLCDVLLAFAGLGGGDFRPDDSLKMGMASFLMDHVFSDSNDEDEDEEELRMAGLLRRRNQLVGYCKLIVYEVLELTAVTDVLKHYCQFYNDYGDIIRETLSRSKMISSEESARTLGLCLQQLFSGMDQTNSVQEMKEIRLLAKKLAMSFGVNLGLIQKPLLLLHQDGILFSLRGAGAGDLTYLSFLEILSEFSFKLKQVERKQLLQHLLHVCADVLDHAGVKMYQHSLTSGSRRTAAAASSSASPARKRRRSRTLSSGSSGNPESARLLTEQQLSPSLDLGEEDEELMDEDDDFSESSFTLPSTRGSILESLFQ